MRARSLLATATLAASALAPLVVPGTAHAAATNVYDDFNGDGHRDVAYSYQYSGENGWQGGAVLVRYGTGSGLYNGPTQLIHQDSPGIPDTGEENDSFGQQLSSADVNKDGYADLVVGNPSEEVGGLKGRGTVTLVWGGASGLSGARTLPCPANSEWAGFGSGIATGDFNGDGSPDVVTLAYGSAWLHRGPITATSTGTVSRIDKSGFDPVSVAAGRVTNDGRTDLVLGGMQADFASSSGGGYTAAWFLRGASGGLTSGASKRLSPTTNPYGLGAPPSIAIGDFDRDGYGDTALGTPADSGDRGAVTVWYGTSTGPSTTRSAKFTQNSTGVPGGAEAGDQFGYSVSAGDTNGDGYRDLAVGVPFEDSGTTAEVGGVTLFRGGSGGLSGSRSVWIGQNTAGVGDASEAYDVLGYGVRLRDASGDGLAELLMTAPNEGLANVLPGSATGPTGTGSVVLDRLGADGLLD